ncbi:hypothetical protein G5B37_12455 [Rasiella rasia]|uniref:Prenyltransferase n=1 Tax=Rasiella rasia TaxID=2744027 RepID=A0A6G6GPI8_9FLAO|nr:hypothetical protein [Rasiella rasia]QIE60343.1 hypothetical protein G5B37_12455 [Rasiella rasia]
MQWLRQQFRFYIHASIHVAFAVVSLVGVTVLEFDLNVPIALWFFVFFGTISGYNFVKYAKIAGLHHRSLAQSLRAIQVFSAISMAGVFLSMFFLTTTTLIVAFGFGLLTLFYAVPLFRSKNLRNIIGLKIFVVALVWAGVTVAVPIVEEGMTISGDFWITLSQRTLIVLALILPFEIRDLQFDRVGLKTVPQRYGVMKTKGLGISLLTLVVLLEGLKNMPSVWSLYALLCTMILIGLAIGYARKKQSEYFASFWVESIPIIWVSLLFLFRHFFS